MINKLKSVDSQRLGTRKGLEGDIYFFLGWANEESFVDGMRVRRMGTEESDREREERWG